MAIDSSRTIGGVYFAAGESGGEARRVRRLVDLAAEQAERLPFSEALAAVIDQVAVQRALPAFLAADVGYSPPLAVDRLWRAGSEGQPGYMETAAPPRRAGFVTGGGQWGGSVRVAVSRKVPAVAAVAELRGLPGALALLRLAAKRSSQASDLARLAVAQLAILQVDAERLFEKKSAGMKAVGPAWPHTEGDAWSDEERDAMFTMRHVERMTDQAIADRVGCQRSRVGQVIGTKDQWKVVDAFKGQPWKPSAALLRACSLQLQPLQAAAIGLADEARNTA